MMFLKFYPNISCVINGRIIMCTLASQMLLLNSCYVGILHLVHRVS